MGTSLFTNYEEVVAMLLFGIGFTTLLFNRNLLKKIIGFNFMDTGIYLFLTSMGYIEGGLAPIYVEGLSTAESYINPIPAGLVLTGIVVSVSVTAIMLSLTVRLYRRYHTLNLDEIYMYAQNDHDETIPQDEPRAKGAKKMKLSTLFAAAAAADKNGGDKE